MRIGIDARFEPFSQVDPGGTPRGLLIERLQAVFARAAIEFEFVPSTLAEVEQALADGHIDLIGFKGVTAARRRTLDFSLPLMATGAALFVAAPGPAPAIEDIAGSVVTPAKGPLAALIATDHPGLDLRLAAGYDESLALVADHAVDAAALNVHAGAEIAALRFAGRIAPAGPVFARLDFAIAARKGEGDRLLPPLNAAIAALQSA